MSDLSPRKKHRPEAEYTALLNRLNRIEGQVRGLKKMLQSDAYCVDILTQVSATRAALNAFGRKLLNEHIRTCVAGGIRAGEEDVVDELLNTLEKMMK